MADQNKKPVVVKNYREFRKQQSELKNPKPKPIPEIIQVQHPPQADIHPDHPAVITNPQPEVSAAPLPVFENSEEIVNFLKQNAIIPSDPASALTASAQVIEGSQVNDGVVEGDPNKVVIAGKTYEVVDSAMPAPEVEKPVEIVTADVVETYIPQNEAQFTEYRICIKPPPSFELGKHPWIYDEAVATAQLRLVENNGRHSLFLGVPEETVLYPLEFVFLKGGVRQVAKVATFERLEKNAGQGEEHFISALEKFKEILINVDKIIPVSISVMKGEKNTHLCVTFPTFVSRNAFFSDIFSKGH